MRRRLRIWQFGRKRAVASPTTTPKVSSKKPIKIDELEKINLTAGEAFSAMGKFVAAFSSRVRVESALATLSADIRVEQDGRSADPAALEDWLASVNEVLEEREEDSG